MHKFLPLLLLPLHLAACDDPTDRACTEIGCTSTFTLTVDHSLDLTAEGASYHLWLTPEGRREIRCNVAGPEGENSCIGTAFADVRWDEEQIVIELQSPFQDAATNPGGEPWPTYDLTLLEGLDELWSESRTTPETDPLMPNGEGCPPTCWQVEDATGIVLD